MYNLIYRLPKISLILFLLAILIVPARGDTITIQVAKRDIWLYEPIVVDVTLLLESPFSAPTAQAGLNDTSKAMKELRRLRRRLHVELRSAEQANSVCRGLLLGVEFVPPKTRTNELHATGLVFLGTRKGARILFDPCDSTGAYHVVVVDRENKLESNSIPLHISSTGANQMQAASLFRSTFPEAIGVIWEHKVNDTHTLDVFKKIVRDYPETVYGRYASASIAVLDYNNTFSRHNNKGGASIWKPVATNLKKAVNIFEEKHPLRERILFELCRAQAMAKEFQEAKQTAVRITSEFPNGRLKVKVRKLISELEKEARKGNRAGSK